MSPDEEDRNSYFAIDVYRMGRGFFVISTCLTLAGLYFAAHPHYLDETHTSNRTAYVIKNYKVRKISLAVGTIVFIDRIAHATQKP
uniref:Uncharacterized protein n=1 Tax=Caenorhabditis japonica TaxID=281687 RepID=A0A8R1I2M2_CAEJA